MCCTNPWRNLISFLADSESHFDLREGWLSLTLSLTEKNVWRGFSILCSSLTSGIIQKFMLFAVIHVFPWVAVLMVEFLFCSLTLFYSLYSLLDETCQLNLLRADLQHFPFHCLFSFSFFFFPSLQESPVSSVFLEKTI